MKKKEMLIVIIVLLGMFLQAQNKEVYKKIRGNIYMLGDETVIKNIYFNEEDKTLKKNDSIINVYKEANVHRRKNNIIVYRYERSGWVYLLERKGKNNYNVLDTLKEYREKQEIDFYYGVKDFVYIKEIDKYMILFKILDDASIRIGIYEIKNKKFNRLYISNYLIIPDNINFENPLADNWVFYKKEKDFITVFYTDTYESTTIKKAKLHYKGGKYRLEK